MALAHDGIPWPTGSAPYSNTLDQALQLALSTADLERAEEFLEAVEPGEDREHAQAFQFDVDNDQYTLDRLFITGDALFGHEFAPSEGYGTGEFTEPQRVHQGLRGGLDSYSCAGCHFVGGADGAGSLTQNAFLDGDGIHVSSAIVRNAPALLGLGFIQALGAEMTRTLQLQRDAAVAQALDGGVAVTAEMEAKGVHFGTLTAQPDGTLETGALAGVDADLVIKPFGWKGDVARLRRFVESAARIHFGVQSHVLAERARTTPDVARLGDGPNWWDPDNDGIQRELEEGTLTAGAVYLAMLESPVILPPPDPVLRERWTRGSALLDEVQCTTCHRRELLLTSPFWREMPDTTAGSGVLLNLMGDGDFPKSGSYVALFSDLKRHDMGHTLADARPLDGLPAAAFLTRPLWGLADSAPYLHDGRALTLDEAIVAHGGEAEESRNAYAALNDDGKRDLQIFLLSLTRMPRLRVVQ